jgi:hypothetical protein
MEGSDDEDVARMLLLFLTLCCNGICNDFSKNCDSIREKQW